MPSLGTCIQVLVQVALLFFIIPFRIDRPMELESLFQEYLRQFNKTYNTSENYQKHFEAFKNSLNLIDELNSNRTELSAKYGLTKFSDMTPREFANNHLQSKRLKMSKMSAINKREKRTLYEIPPKSVDWRKRSVIGQIRDQAQCGACWAFSGVETIESMLAINSGKFVELSVQEAIDCAMFNNGCNGGDTCNMFYWMMTENVSLQTEKDYPLELKQHHCRIQKNSAANGFWLKDYVCYDLVEAEDHLLQILANHGPVAVAINAQLWQNYIGGVIAYHCGGDNDQLNHAVQIVGYNLNAKIPYYIVRNTWGYDFGDSGYLYLAIGKNICGLANEVAVVSV